MKRILLLIEHRKNRYLLSQWLTGQYQILSPEADEDFVTRGEQLLSQSFDLCFVDFAAIRKLRQPMLARRKVELPIFLPFVFLTSLQDIGISTDHLEDLIDEIIHVPIKKIELQTKLRILMRSRSYSLQLQAAKQQLDEALSQEKELNQLKSRFISMVSHEFRNPLNSISGMAQILKTYGDGLTPEKKAEVFEQLERNVVKMQDLLDDVLAISRKDLNKLQFKPAPLDLEIFCRSLIDHIQTTFSHKQPINFLYQTEQKQFNLDQKLLHHILTNLLANACKYSPPNSPIDFEVCCQDSDIVFTIRDRGIGIPPEDLPHLFDSFYRARNTRDVQGTGLGLAIAKQYVDLHQGKISVTSELNQGSTFIVTIPVEE